MIHLDLIPYQNVAYFKFILLSILCKVYFKYALCIKYTDISVLVVYLQVHYFNTPWDKLAHFLVYKSILYV